ncbi:two-component system response regulator [Ectothiorhodospira shaposhnikovii]|uniref:putative bifunctional diguanylate cyclase/phosphodiesterase n=1 Tax=Ectothiorhodospira shaposhnikovii TaxID=1054 RepID=UPI0019063DB2|nr:EAL domain-containing protein [Ectothiorhodospira shaposhnikovii]MBK1672054.1 two-component system response regulator [Ectothiorhodospira shaposhnikovii]
MNAQLPGFEQKDPATARILLVDDDLRLLESLRHLLELHDFRADTAGGGRAAMEKLRERSYDLVLLDLGMPEVGGRDVLRFMATEQMSCITVVVSANGSVQDMTAALRDGAYDYLRKPYVPEELLATVNNALRRKHLEDMNCCMRGRLERSERLHRMIVNNSPDIVFILDKAGHFSFINSRVTDLLGYERESLLGSPLLALVDDEDREKAAYFLGQVMRRHRDVRSVELILRPSGRVHCRRHFEVAVWPQQEEHEETPFGDMTHSIYGTARDITERKESEAFITFQAYHDLLTRLPNRALFKDRVSLAIAHARRRGTRLAVMFIDLNRFKIINDSLGHAIGDRLLQSVSQRLLATIRQGDTLSRFGGDEFTLLLPEVQDAEAAGQVAQKLLDSLSRPFQIGVHELYVGASIGIAIYPEQGQGLDELIRHADIAMYREKRSRKNGFRVFNPEMGSDAIPLQLEQDFRRALERREFQLVYQPQVDTAQCRLAGVEALVRWPHPVHGVLGPVDFIPLAEETRLILELDHLTLRTALEEVGRCHLNGHAGMRLAVNLSPIVVEHDDFVDRVKQSIADSGFPPHLLELEITESLLMSDGRATVEKLGALSSLGIRFAIDDFGTGYSSLSYLQKLPVHTLKIDRSFTQGISAREDEACLVNAIVSMAKGLQMGVVTEGVETLVQMDYLRSLGCPMMQGYLFGRPATLSDIIERPLSLPSAGRFPGQVDELPEQV